VFDKRFIKSQEVQHFIDDKGIQRKRILFRYHRAIPLEKKKERKKIIMLFEDIKNAIL
tara:strand:+ start:723 stop:896 length:174 start_codon:yes stop_codon:yes gene_type:complete